MRVSAHCDPRVQRRRRRYEATCPSPHARRGRCRQRSDYDVYWRHGRPYYRVTREPVYVVRNYRGGPRYYYHARWDNHPRYEHHRYNAWRDRDYDRRYYYDDDGARVRITYDSDWD
jgi:hypothetical protein